MCLFVCKFSPSVLIQQEFFTRMYSGLLDTTHLNWKLGARMRDSVNGKIEMEVGTEKFEREKVGSGMFLGRQF